MCIGMIVVSSAAAQSTAQAPADETAWVPPAHTDPAAPPARSVEPSDDDDEHDMLDRAGFYDARLRFGGAFDSNVGPFGRRTRHPGYPEIHDTFAGVDFDFNVAESFRLDHFLPGRQLTLGIGGRAKSDWHAEVSAADNQLYDARAFMEWQLAEALCSGKDELWLGLQYDHGIFRQGGRTPLALHRLEPSLTVIWTRDDANPRLYNDQIRSDLYFAWEQRDYGVRIPEPVFDATGEYQTYGVKHTHAWETGPILEALLRGPRDPDRDPGAGEAYDDDYLRWYLGYEFRSDRTVGDAFDRGGHVLLTGGRIPLWEHLSFEGKGEWGWYGYDHASLSDDRGRRQRDFEQRYDTALVYDYIFPRPATASTVVQLSFRGGVALTFRDTNIFSRDVGQPPEFSRARYYIAMEIHWIPIRTNPWQTGGQGTMPIGGILPQPPPPPIP